MKPNLDSVTPSEESKENEMRIELEEEVQPTSESRQTEIAEQGFTRGPWFTKWNGAYGHMVYGSDGSGSAVAVVSGVAPGITTAQGKANARLMAAAPALYEALKATSCRYSRVRECVGPEMCDRCAALALVDNPQTNEVK